jgi:peptidoglycan/LPS O-acetylase OafA/YrhL
MQRLGYRAELDGVRALAVLGIMAFHDSWPGVRGGNAVLSWFFVLSGFLITTLIREEQDRYGTIDLGRFYLRRILRLFPSLYLVIVVCFIVSMTNVAHIDKREFISAGLYFSNMHLLAFGPDAPQIFLEHTWSLSLEEHFYLVWPIIIMKMKTVRSAMIFCGSAIFVSFVVRFLHATNAWRSPYETLSFFSLEGFAIGAILAYQIRNPRVARLLDRSWVLLACAIYGALDIIFVINRENVITPFRHIIGNFVIAVLLLHVVVHPEMAVGKLLRNKALVYIGVISYAMYLWHFPVFEMFKEFRQPNMSQPLRHVMKFGVSFALAVATYHAIEKPLMAVRSRLRSRAVAPTPVAVS